jgi:cytochrome c
MVLFLKILCYNKNMNNSLFELKALRQFKPCLRKNMLVTKKMKDLMLSCTKSTAAVIIYSAFYWVLPVDVNAALPSSLQNNNCFSCHAQQQNLMGPSWKAIRARYQAQTNAQEVLSKSIMQGVSGKWGEIPMPSNPQLSQADADAISQWILSGK